MVLLYAVVDWKRWCSGLSSVLKQTRKPITGGFSRTRAFVSRKYPVVYPLGQDDHFLLSRSLSSSNAMCALNWKVIGNVVAYIIVGLLVW